MAHQRRNRSTRKNKMADLPVLGIDRAKKIKEYNFKNPDKFSKEHLRVLASVHEVFCRQANMSLNAVLRMQAEIAVTNFQQMTYASYLNSIPDKKNIIATLSMYPFNSEFCLAMDREVLSVMIDRLLGGKGVAKDDISELTDVEIGIIQDILMRLLKFYPEGWRLLIPAADEVDLNGIELSANSVQIVPATDIVAVVTMNIRVAEVEGTVSVCLPYAALEDVITRLNKQSAYKNDRSESAGDAREFIINKLSTTTLLVKIVLANGELNLSDISNLQIGDVIKTNTRADANSEVWIGEELKFYGRPGQLGNKLSVTIEEPYLDD